MKKIINTLTAITCAVWLAIGIWMFASWCDIVADNTSGNPTHSEYNFFIMAMDARK